jgi:hypothetical protein
MMTLLHIVAGIVTLTISLALVAYVIDCLFPYEH